MSEEKDKPQYLIPQDQLEPHAQDGKGSQSAKEGDDGKKGGLVLPDQILPPNLFILPLNGPVVYPTLLAPLLISNSRHVAMIEEAINRGRMLGLMLTREGVSKPEGQLRFDDLYNVGV